ncbi:hypothetical protein BROWWM01_80390 [Bradyrhizobium ottawaense]
MISAPVIASSQRPEIGLQNIYSRGVRFIERQSSNPLKTKTDPDAKKVTLTITRIASVLEFRNENAEAGDGAVGTL